jgi:ABC-type uncharacterized transport system
MATSTKNASEPKTSSSFLESVARRPRETAYGLFAATLVFIGLAIFLGLLARSRWPEHKELISLCAWSILVAVLALATGAWQMLLDPEEKTDVNRGRMLVLLLGGVFGFLMFLLGIALVIHWWDILLTWTEVGKAEKPHLVMLAVATLVAGLGVMFLSLQVARTQERSDPTVRRLLYGYNAVLTGLLLLAILAVINIFVYLKFPTSLDFTAEGIYTLNPRSKNILEGLEKPTKVYAILYPGGTRPAEVKNLLTSCREVNDRLFQPEYLDPDLDGQRVQELQRQYGVVGREGLLIVYGNDDKAPHSFIKSDDIFDATNDRFPTPDSSDKPGFKFKGEDALMTELNYLAEGQKKPVVYFTQGNGELDLQGMDSSRPDQGCGLLRQRLEQRRFEVKPLKFSPSEPRVPDDADLVVMAGPRSPLPDFAMQALRNYMSPSDPNKKKGKMMVLLGLVPAPDGGMAQTGVESLLAEFKVQVGNERILSWPSIQNRSPQQVIVLANPAQVDRNPIATSFAENPFLLINARPVRIVNDPGSRPGGAFYSAEPIFVTVGATWAESNLRGEISQIIAQYAKKPRDIESKIETLNVAAAATEPPAMTPGDPHAMLRGQGKEKPRLVVFGDASLASNYLIERGGGIHFQILASCLDWLRERPTSMGIDPKQRDRFVLSPTFHLWRAALVPGVLLLIGILGLGTGVWVVRRK